MPMDRNLNFQYPEGMDEPSIPAQPAPPPAASPGRPTDYTSELRDEICLRLSTGRTLRSVCRDEDMPVRSTIYEWIIANKGEEKAGDTIIEHGFSDHYARARELGLEEINDETIDIADDGTNDFVEREGRSGTYIAFDKEAVMRSRLRVDTRQKYLENMAPRKYGKNLKVQSQALDAKGDPVDPGNKVTDDFMTTVLDAIKKGEAKADG